MDTKEAVEYFVSNMKEQGMDIAKKFIYEGIISCEAELIPHIMSTIVSVGAENYYKMLAEYIKIDKEIKEKSKLGINDDGLKEKHFKLFDKINMCVIGNLEKNILGLEKETSGEKIDKKTEDKFLPKLWKDEKCLEDANRFLEVNELKDLQIVEGRHQSGKKEYFICIRNECVVKQIFISHPDPMDAAYAAITGERPEIKEK